MRPDYQCFHERADALARLSVHEPAVRIELLGGVGYEDFGLVEHEHIERRARFPQVQLGSQSARASSAHSKDRHGLAVTRLVGRM